MKTINNINLNNQASNNNLNLISHKSCNLNSNKLECRYCLCEESTEHLIQPCNCEGSLRFVHNNCLGEWIKNSRKSYEIIYENNIAYYTSSCEICKYNMKYQINFENNFLVSFYYTIKNTLFSIKSCFLLILHSLVIFYFFNRLTFLIYHGIYVVSKNFKTKYLMRFVNEMAIFSTILWYTNDIIRYYGNLFFEQRKSLLVFLPKVNNYKKQFQNEFNFEMTLETHKSNNNSNLNDDFCNLSNTNLFDFNFRNDNILNKDTLKNNIENDGLINNSNTLNKTEVNLKTNTFDNLNECTSTLSYQQSDVNQSSDNHN